MSAEPGPPHRLLAILAADAVGFSALMARDDQGTLARLQAAREVFRRACTHWGGRVVDTAGDSVLAAFDSAGAAVAAALSAQADLGGGAPPSPSGALPFRIGLHLGDVLQHADGTLYGDGVNIAARLQALAEPGGIVVSQAVHAIVAARAAAAFDDLGERELKHLGTMRVFRARAVAAETGAAPATSSSTAPAAAGALRFGPPEAPQHFELQPRERRLLVDGSPANLGARAFDLLLALVDRAGTLVSKNELLDLVWPGLVVEEANLSVQVSSLRKVLGGEIIATIPGRGYRFTAPLAAPTAGPAPGATGPTVGASAAGPIEPAPLKTNLPATLTPLLGRSDEFAALTALLAEHRLVSIVGAGGMGKTLLSQHLLQAQQGRWPHGVCFVELAPVASAAGLPAALAAALGLQLGSGEPVAALADLLAPLELLAVLDNAEHLVEPVAALVAALLAAAPGLRLLVTSQAPLRLPVERVHRVGALAVPAGVLPAEEARAFGAVALFEERARTADSRFVLRDADVGSVIDTVRALDGLPLAIELAAARAGTLGLPRLAQAMGDRLRLLTRGGNRQAPARQQTLRAALEWSHGLLGPAEQAVFRRLAVMPGPADLEAVQAIVADADADADLDTDPGAVPTLDAWAVLDALAELVERSLVALLPGPDGAADAPRYRLLDSPLALAQERLQAAGEAEALRRRHAQVWAARVQRETETWARKTMSTEALLADAEHVAAALDWALAQPAGRALALSLLPSALPLASVVSAAETLRLAGVAARLTAPEACQPGEQLAAAWVLEQASTSLSDLRPAQASALAQRGLALLDEVPAPAQPALLRFRLKVPPASSWLSRSAENRESGAADLQCMVGLLQPSWPAWAHADLAFTQGHLAMAAGRLEDALEANRRAAALGQDAMGANNVIDALNALRRFAEARDQGLTLLQRIQGSRDASSLSFARLNLAAAHLALDEAPEARALAQAGWDPALHLEHNAWWADYLALLLALEGRPADAARLAGYADAAYRAHDDTRQPNEAEALDRALALARSALGEPAVAALQAEGQALADAAVAALVFGGGAPA